MCFRCVFDRGGGGGTDAIARAAVTIRNPRVLARALMEIVNWCPITILSVCKSHTYIGTQSMVVLAFTFQKQQQQVVWFVSFLNVGPFIFEMQFVRIACRSEEANEYC